MGLLFANAWRNVNGSSRRPQCRCGSWLQHWRNYANSDEPQVCSVLGCDGTPTHGGHIRNQYVSGERIVPLCTSCNAQGEDFFFNLKIGVVGVIADRSETCDRAPTRGLLATGLVGRTLISNQDGW